MILHGQRIATNGDVRLMPTPEQWDLVAGYTEPLPFAQGGSITLGVDDAPGFPECIDNFGFLWFEDEAVVAGSASWVVAGNAAAAITREIK